MFGTAAQRQEVPENAAIHQIAVSGVHGAGTRLPHFKRIQESFGQYDVSGIQAYTGATAAVASRAIGATAYTTGNKIAFSSPSPDLHTTAHEATHVFQQAAGVQLRGGVGEVGDRYERHANEVADTVVQGRSAENLLDRVALVTTEGSARTAATRASAVQKLPNVPEIDEDEENAITSYRRGGHRAIQQFLRGLNTATTAAREARDVTIPLLNSALRKMQISQQYEYRDTLWRGDRFDAYSEEDQDRLDTRGARITIAPFFSTSKSKATGRTFSRDYWEITRNHSGVDIHSARLGIDEEQEVLFPSGSVFRITRPRRKKGWPWTPDEGRPRKVTAEEV
ncbi:MAG: DUF4157 domain-containing protein [Proteobacteria bacterium]|nr:DUF4157 domain-containing protein [Pseudomonadota bacterium]